jgi:predicted HTH transcriptional regulator
MPVQLAPKELLWYLLKGNTLTPDNLDQFIREHPHEDQDFDYKDGKIATRQERQKGSQIIRAYVSGFANSEGGVLIIGVGDDPPRMIRACASDIGGQPLTEWASRCLQGMAGYFSPQPRFQVIHHPHNGPVLSIAVARAPSLVPCVEAGVLKYFFRIGDSTLPIPDYGYAVQISC